MNSGSIFFWFKKEKMGSFCPNLLLRDCHFSFPSMLTLLWPLQAIQRCKKKVAVLRQLLVPDPLSFRLYWPCQHRAPFFFTNGDNRGQSFCEGDLWQESGMWSPQRVSGPDLSILSFFKCFSTNTCPVWRLSEADVCSLAGSDVIFLFNYFEVRQIWRMNAAMKRKGD